MQIQIIAQNRSLNPANLAELSLQINHRENTIIDGKISTSVSLNRWRFTGDDAEFFNQIIQAGRIFEGIPMDIRLSHSGRQYNLPLYLDMTDGMQVSCNDITISSKVKKSIDWFMDRAEGTTFEGMYNANPQWFKDHQFYVPTVINTAPQYREAFMAIGMAAGIGLVAFSMAQQLVAQLANLASEAPWGSPVELLATIATFLAMVAQIASYLLDFISYIIQPVRFNCGMYFNDMLQAFCNHIGIDYASSVFDTYPLNKLFYLPEKYEVPATIGTFESVETIARGIANFSLQVAYIAAFLQVILLGLATIVALLALIVAAAAGVVIMATRNNDAKIKGYLVPNPNQQRGYFNGTFKQFLDLCNMIINGKATVRNNTLFVERRDFRTGAPLYTIPGIRNDFHSLNTEEFNRVLRIKFLTDVNDKNTIEQYAGTSASYEHEPIAVIDPELILGKGFKEIGLPVARGLEKTDLTVPENILLSMLGIVDVLSKLIEDTINFIIDQINNLIKIFFTVFDFIADIFNSVLQAEADAVNAVIDLIEDVINDLIGVLNSMIDTINVVIGYVNTLAGSSIPGVPYISVIALPPVIFNPINFSSLIYQRFIIDHIAIPRLSGFVSSRIGMLMTENELIDKPKVFLFEGDRDTPRNGRVLSDNRAVVNARNILERFYEIDTFADGAVHNQWRNYELDDVDFYFEDYENLKDTNQAVDYFGNLAEILSVEWNIHAMKAKITYRVNQLYTNNFRLRYHEYTGQ